VYDPIFQNRSDDTRRCLHKDYISINRWQANRDLLFVFFFITTHLRQGKKVIILPSGDVNSRPVASMRGLLEAVPIVQ
jgi:hypothetical protein